MSFKVLYYYHFLFFFSFLTFFPYLLFFGEHCASCCDLSFIFLLLCMLAKSIYIFFFFEVHFFWFTCHPIYVAYYLDYDSSDGRFSSLDITEPMFCLPHHLVGYKTFLCSLVQLLVSNA